MTDSEKEEIRSIVRKELVNILQEARGTIGSDSTYIGRQIIDVLTETVGRRELPQASPPRRGRSLDKK